MRHLRILIRTASATVLAVALFSLAFPAGGLAQTPTPGAPAPSVQPSPGPSASADPSTSPQVRTSPPVHSPEPSPTGGDGLPVTGAQIGGMVVLGGGLIAAGIAMMAVRRRDLSDLDLTDG